MSRRGAVPDTTAAPQRAATPAKPEAQSEAQSEAQTDAQIDAQDADTLDTELTPSGLPMRVPQANLAPALREDVPPAPADEEDDDERSPEEIRAMMGSLQSGTRLGRSEAAKFLEDQQ